MIKVNLRMALFALVIAALPLQEAWSAASRFQGAWVDEGVTCASVFVAAPKAVGFRRPASAFAPAFIIAGQRIVTPLATCRIVSVSPNGPREIMNLSCTTSVTTNSARAVFAPAEDGGLYRYHAVEGGIATKYRLCSREALKTP